MRNTLLNVSSLVEFNELRNELKNILDECLNKFLSLLLFNFLRIEGDEYIISPDSPPPPPPTPSLRPIELLPMKP